MSFETFVADFKKYEGRKAKKRQFKKMYRHNLTGFIDSSTPLPLEEILYCRDLYHVLEVVYINIIIMN